MKEILIKAITSEGAAALKQNYEKKIPLKEKMVFKAMGYSQILLSEDPYILILRICNKRMEEPEALAMIRKEIIKGFPTVAQDVDYAIEEKCQ